MAVNHLHSSSDIQHGRAGTIYSLYACGPPDEMTQENERSHIVSVRTQHRICGMRKHEQVEASQGGGQARAKGA